MPKGTSVFGRFPTIEGAQHAVDRLVHAGIPRERLGLLISSEARRRFPSTTNHTRAAEGMAASGIAGDAPGGALGGLSKVAALATPGSALPAEPLVSLLPGDVDEADGPRNGKGDGGVAQPGVQRANDLLAQEGVLVTLSMNDQQLVDTAERVLDEAGATLVTTRKGQAGTE